MSNEQEKLDAAQIGKMFVTSVNFRWVAGDSLWDENKRISIPVPAHWNITARLSEELERYGNCQEMTIKVEQGVGQKLAEVLLPVIIADASRKAQQLADDSKAMLQALGDRTLACIADMPQQQEGK